MSFFIPLEISEKKLLELGPNVPQKFGLFLAEIRPLSFMKSNLDE
jgi:hypothetical protein